MEDEGPAESRSEAAQFQEPLLETRTSIPDADNIRQEVDHEIYVYESPPRRWWRGDCNLYMGICYVMILWFVTRLGPARFMKPISTLAGIHVVAACTYGIICCMNVFHTPKQGAIYRRIHMNLGRVGMVAGLVSVLCGMTALYAQENPLGMRIGLTYAGVAQFSTQAFGLYELFKPKRNLKMHAYYMRQSLLYCCFIPAIMRLPQLTGWGLGEGWLAYAWVFAIPLYMSSERATKQSEWF